MFSPRKFQQFTQTSLGINNNMPLPEDLLQAYRFLGWDDSQDKPYPGYREGIIDWLEVRISTYMGDLF